MEWAMSKWRFGCGKPMTVFTHSERRGYREHKVECGSTAFDGGVNQCDECERKYPVKSPLDDESDLDWFDRQNTE